MAEAQPRWENDLAFGDHVLYVEEEAVVHVYQTYPNNQQDFSVAHREFGDNTWFNGQPEHYDNLHDALARADELGQEYMQDRDMAHAEMATHFDERGQLLDQWERNAHPEDPRFADDQAWQEKEGEVLLDQEFDEAARGEENHTEKQEIVIEREITVTEEYEEDEHGNETLVGIEEEVEEMEYER